MPDHESSHRPVLSVRRCAEVQADDPDFPVKVEALRKELSLWEGYLSKNTYVAGDEFTLADLALGPWVLFFVRQGATLKEFPKLAAYAGMLKVRMLMDISMCVGFC